MKRILILAMALLMCCGAALAEVNVGLANPWVETSAEGLMDLLGLKLGVPEGATDVSWRMMESAQMGELSFTWEGLEYTARVAPAEAFEDISGMYYEWEQQVECTVGRGAGTCYRAQEEGLTIDLCLWYDDLTGLMYSLTTSDADLDGFDIGAAAEQVYIPMQTE